MPTFFRIHADKTREAVGLDNMYAGPVPSACWLVGGGPSLARLPYRKIAASPVPVMAVNLAGAGLVRPNFWTAYDNSARFHTSIYLDPGILKLVQTRRATDLVPGTSFKVCECPNLFFFERDGQRGFADFLAPTHTGIVDWADSFVQAIDLLYRLGFRKIFLAGCEMRVSPSPAQVELARQHGVEHDPKGLLRDFLTACEGAGLSASELHAAGAARPYHFDEAKRLAAAANTDLHYFRVAQYLRLSRRAISLAGVELVSVTPGSRLNDYFRYASPKEAIAEIGRQVPDPATEPTRGLYHETVSRTPLGLGPMRDYLPHNWKKAEAHNRNLDGLRRALPPQAEPDRDAPSPPPDLVLEREERVAVAPGKPGARSKQERVFDLLDAIEHAGGPIREEG
jgi:hypothetical protein